MDLKKAQQVARHHLGDRFHWVGKGGPTADEWIVQAWPDTGHMIHAQAATVAEAAADCASQLRAAGWVPTHPRLEWESSKWQHHLCFLTDSFRVELFFVYNSTNGWTVWRRHDADNEVIACRVTASIAAEHIAAWHAANLPSYHLPTFPGAAQ